MLRNIPKVITPELMKILMEMGHGYEIVIATSESELYANIILKKGVVIAMK